MGDNSFLQFCIAGDVEGVQAAIANGVDVNEASYFGDTGLMVALLDRNHNVLQLLLQHPQIDINKVDHHGRSALHFAVIHDNREGLAALLPRNDVLTTSINQFARFENFENSPESYQ